MFNHDDLKSSIREVMAELLANFQPKQASAMTPRKYTREQLADEVLHVSLPTIHGMMKQGILPYVKVGRRTLFDADVIDAMVARGELKKYRRIGR